MQRLSAWFRLHLKIILGYHQDMCYRYVAPGLSEIVQAWEIQMDQPAVFSSAVEVRPTDRVPVVRAGADGKMRLDIMRWGLIPSWWKERVPPKLTFNARSEEAARKPSWRESYQGKRCLMPARGWFEWKEPEPGGTAGGRKKPPKQPYYVTAPQDHLIAFAALFARWRSPDGEEIESCALLTRAASEGLSFLHPRMPLVLPAALYFRWLGPAAPEEVAGMIAAAREDFSPLPLRPE